MNKHYEEEIVYKLDGKQPNCYRDPVQPNRFWFKFPETWATSTIFERVIGFRSLWIPLAQRILKFNIEIVVTKEEGETCITNTLDIPFLIYLNVQDHFEDIIKDMNQQIQAFIDKNTPTSSDASPEGGTEDWRTKNLPALSLDMLNIRYETKDHIKCFIIDGENLTFRLYNQNDDAKAIFNSEDYKEHQSNITCSGIWTRHRCLLRSSISINNSKNYLGYSQKNYNPVKYYKIQCNETRFSIDLMDAHDEDAIVTLPRDNKEGMCLEIILP